MLSVNPLLIKKRAIILQQKATSRLLNPRATRSPIQKVYQKHDPPAV